MCAAESAAPLAAAETAQLFGRLSECPVLLLAVSGGPDSTALMVLMARWRATLKRPPRLVAVTVDHGLRPQARHEAFMVRSLARRLGVEHRIVRWAGRKPRTGIQEAARKARYRLLAEAARRAGARCVVTAHTLDDQAETVLFRIARGSGITGLGGMEPLATMPGDRTGAIELARPLLSVPKERLVATLRAAKIPFAEDPTNRDPRFARPRLRALMPALTREGLSPQRLAVLARRLRRADAALESMVDAAIAALAPLPWPERGPVSFSLEALDRLPGEVVLRLIGRAVAAVGDEGPVELGKLEALVGALGAAGSSGARMRRTLAGAMINLASGRITVERAPPRSRHAGASGRRRRP